MEYEIPSIESRRDADYNRECENYYVDINEYCPNSASVVLEYDDGSEVALCDNCRHHRT